jgi:DNA-binding CsgD family transcriptional regulator
MKAPEWRVAEIIRRCHAGLDAPTLVEELLRRLADVVPFDAGLLATTDPATLLYTGAALAEQSHVTHMSAFLANEYLDDDVMKYADLAGGSQRVDWLDRSTQGRPSTSRRYREILAPLGLGDELRAAFVAGGSCWGVGCLTRAVRSVPFTEDDARVIGRLGPHIADGLRTSLLLREASRPDPDPAGPGVLMLDEDLSVLATTPAAERWLDEIADDRFNGLPPSIVNVVAVLHSLDGSGASSEPQPRVRVRTASGRWLVLHASYLAADPGVRTVVVVIEPAQRNDLAPLILQTHGLTPKESEVARLALLGHSTKEIGAALFISDHTVQDHFKAVFEKVGVGSRRELVTRMLSDQYPGFAEPVDLPG